MKTITSVLITVVLFALMAMPVSAQNKPATKPFNEVLCKEWKLKNYELFGVSHPPDTAQMFSDRIEFSSDGTFKISNLSGGGSIGTWVAEAKNTFLSLTYYETRQKRSLKVIEWTETTLVLQYQTPDLIKTKFFFTSEK